VTDDDKGTVRVWDAVTGKERASFEAGTIGHDTGRGVSGVSPDGKIVATSSGMNYSSALALWDATTGKLLSDLPGHPSGITAAGFAPDGTKVFTIGKDRTLRTWDPATGRELSRTLAEP